MENYKEKYENALSQAKQAIENIPDKALADWLKGIFPELKESNDEKIRKGIKSLLEWNKEQGNEALPYPFVTNDEALAWLEKQGEYKPAEWSEEDERMLCDVIAYAEARISFDGTPQLDWLKSLKNRCCAPEPISIVEKDGAKYVRVCLNDEDFLIAAHDYKEGGKEKFTWEEACKIDTFTKNQAYIICAFKDEINALLRVIDGEPLEGIYWSSTEYKSNYAWFVYFSKDTIYNYRKTYTLSVRPAFTY